MLHTQGLDGSGHFTLTHLGQTPLIHLRLRGSVEHIATFTAGAGNHEHVHTFFDVSGRRRCAFTRLIVRMGVHSE